MHTRRLITLLLGFWFAMMVSIGLSAFASLRAAVQAVHSPPAEAVRGLKSMGQPLSDQLLRYVAAEANRSIFETAGLLELGLVFGIAALLFLQNYSKTATILAGVLLLLALASHFLLTPQVVSMGRILDFRGLDVLIRERERFDRLQMMYGILCVIRLGCGACIATIFLRRKRVTMTRRSTDKVNAFDNA